MAFTLPGSNSAPKFEEVFTIPETQGDTFVLKLSQSVAPERIQQTLDTYVVTDSIAANLKQALGYVRNALDTGNNQGTYLDGSFGSGKSHFMAVLYAILANYPEARAVRELQDLIVSNEDLVKKNYLQLTFHFLGSTTIEGTVFGSYIKQMEKFHPGVALPALHSDAELFRDAQNLRETMGDAAFFAALNRDDSSVSVGDDAGATGGFDIGSFANRVTGGAVGGAGKWDAVSFEAAVRTDDLAKRQELSTALSATLFTSHSSGSNWVPLAEGLKRITDHAAGLGYDAVVLYLDELILWLMFMTPSSEQFLDESQKLTLFVESEAGKLQIPLVSFIARQKNLAAWAATTEAAGSDQSMRKQAFAHQEGRFNKIHLGNSNLPEIAHKRLLEPKNALAEQQLDTAFSDLQLKPDVIQVLLNGENLGVEESASTMEQFKLTYPFSPALVDTLINLSSVMQRERTALKVMENLLIAKRSTGTIGNVIPVGDAFNFLVTGSDSTNDSASQRFAEGREFWNTRMRPTILANHNLDPKTTDEELDRSTLADIRLGKTLVLSALAPQVASLKNLTARRLANLNHGTMATLFESDTVGQVLQTVQRWATDLPEIQVEKGSNDPQISLVLNDVPWKEVLDSARSHDTPAKRKERIRTDLMEAFGVSGTSQGMDQAYLRPFTWRGTSRNVEVIFGNVRDPKDMPDDSFRPSGYDALRIVVDYPFDQEGHTVAEDHRRIDALIADGSRDRFTVAWLPQFFDSQQMRKLGDLVIAEYVTTPTGLRDNTQRIPQDQVQAVESTLKDYKHNLSEELGRQIRVAYGVSAGADFGVDQEPVKSLDPAITVSKPIGSDMHEAVNRLIEKAFEQRYPDHPKFDVNTVIRTSDFNKVLNLLREAVISPDGRVEIPREDRRIVRAILNPLHLADVYETHVIFTADTAQSVLSDIDQALRTDGFNVDGDLGVQPIQEAIRKLSLNRGLTNDVINFFVGAWAALKNRSWYQSDIQMPHPPSIGEIKKSVELRPVKLPDQQQWDNALEMFALLSGKDHPKHRTGANLATFLEKVNEFVEEYRGPIQGLAVELNQLTIKMQAGGSSNRVALNDKLNDLLSALHNQRLNALGMVEVLGTVKEQGESNWGATRQETMMALTSVSEVREQVGELLQGMLASQFSMLLGARDKDETAQQIIAALALGVGQHEMAVPIATTVRKFKAGLDEWIRGHVNARPNPDPVETPPPGPGPKQDFVVEDSNRRVFPSEGATGIDDALTQVKNELGKRTGKYRIIVEWLGD
ncbi:DUF6079 family protein [Corynebacterium breve]|uniref:DUF6079 family protein n=1 Tax=Corynebacterium breve TaxID=3049799 RepID=A0ABY8VDA4_9CORY|nr:DUF6079 family protein [Corynebacterium breve]WIM67644.1 DUF6079 family protein [Corynebacterium breve]